MDDRSRFSPPVVGGSSLLVIFSVLCLTVFALLCLSTVRAGGRLSDASAEAAAAYYEADCRAEEIFARLRNGEMPQGVSEEGGFYTYACPISDTQILQVELARSSDLWTVLRWQAVSVANWEPDMTLDLWDGDPIVGLGQ